MNTVIKIILLISFLIVKPISNNLFAQTVGSIWGMTVDRETEEPLSFVYVHLQELNRTVTAHTDGTFEFRNVPSGDYTLLASRIGYQSISQRVEVVASDSTFVKLALKASVLSGETVEVLGMQERPGTALEHASRTISGVELRQGLGTTLASTLENTPGISSRKMGAAPARPILRGLGGERLLILQDGERTGDVSSQSADHAVTVDPMAAEKIEIARGPAALRYGSNAIGGIINVVRNQIPASLPDHLHGTASIQGATVNSSGVAGLEASAPLGQNIAFKIDGNLRSARNIDTPSGTLANSGIFSTNSAAGISYIQPWGYAGLSSSFYINNYGIPPDPDGGHENGVDIEMEKIQIEGRSEITLPKSFLQSIQTNISYKNYFHKEIEPGGAIGTEYGVLTTNGSITFDHSNLNFFEEGTFGIWGEHKNYAVNGTQTPNSDAYSFAVFVVEEKNWGALHLEGGLRFDYSTITPESEGSSSIGNVRERNFAGLASSASAIYNFGSGFFGGATFMHSYRAPSQEELYSEGPHLASYSYEIGNPDLDQERGLGKEIFLRYKTSSTTTEIALFHNDFSNYIYPQDTGRPSPRFPSLNVYQFTGVNAIFKGFEFSSELKLFDYWALSGGLHYTHARQKDSEDNGWQPLPMIPPLQSTIGVTYAKSGFQIGSKAKIAADQTRTGEFEAPTEGYLIFDLFGQYRFQSGKILHTFSLNADNIFNTTYRSHLSRIKELMPEPGRNLSLLYRMYF